MTRTLPIVLLSTLALGAGYTLAIDHVLGGSVEEAPVRAPASDPIPASERGAADAGVVGGDGYPKEAGNPRLWRKAETAKRKPPTRRRAERRENGSPTRATPRQPVPAGDSPSPRPAPSGSAPSAPPPSSGSPPSAPSPAPAPAPKRAPRPNGGGDFYSTG